MTFMYVYIASEDLEEPVRSTKQPTKTGDQRIKRRSCKILKKVVECIERSVEKTQPEGG